MNLGSKQEHNVVTKGEYVLRVKTDWDPEELSLCGKLLSEKRENKSMYKWRGETFTPRLFVLRVPIHKAQR